MLAGAIYNVVPDVQVAEFRNHPSKIVTVTFATPTIPNLEDDLEEFVIRDRTVFPKETRPAVTPLPDLLFKARDDAERLHTAIEGIGTDEDIIIRILTKRSLDQRMQIAEAYKTLFGFVLSYHLVLETSGTFRELLTALLTPLSLFYARELRDAMLGFGTAEVDLIEIICSLTNHEIRGVKRTYQAVFKSSLEDDIKGDTSDQFQELLVTLLQGNRSEELVVHPLKAKEDAKKLLYASDHNKNSDDLFLHILTSRSMPQLTAICREFKGITGHEIDDYIWTEFSGDAGKALSTIVEIARDGYPMFFARRLHNSMKGFGTNDKKLMRIMVTRSEIDLHDIAIAFRKLYEEKLAAWIEDDCSGDYQLCLLCLLGAKSGYN